MSIVSIGRRWRRTRYNEYSKCRGGGGEGQGAMSIVSIGEEVEKDKVQ